MSQSIRRSRQTAILLSSIAIVALIIGPPSRAIDENLTKGATNNHVFEVGMWGENIDLMNGGLSLTIPIGPTYQVSADVSFQLKLAYSSKIFNVEETGDPWGGNKKHRARSRLQGRGQAGQGFLLQIGRYYQRANSVECENGSTISRLHETGFEDSTGALHSEFGGDWRGSPDGSYTRIRKSSNDNVDMPDGTRYVLGPEIQDLLEELPNHPDPNNWPWCYNTNAHLGTRPQYDTYTNDYRGRYVTKLEGKDRDPNGQAYNYMVIDYDPNTGMKHLMKTITMYRNGVADTARAITFTNTRQNPTDPNLPALEMGYVQSVTLPVFSNDPNTVRTATYTFGYTVADIWDPYATSIVSADPNATPPYRAEDNTDDMFEKVLQLTGITFPEGYTMSFGYGTQADNVGVVKWRVLPTGAKIEYDYDMYPFRPKVCQPGSQVPCPPHGPCTNQVYAPYCGTSPAGYTMGVGAKRIVPDPLYPTQTHTWSYDRTTHAVGRPNPAAVVVTDPFGNDTVTYFHAQTIDSPCCTGGSCYPVHNDNWNNGLTYKTEYYRGSWLDGIVLRSEHQTWVDDVEPDDTGYCPAESDYKHTGEFKRVVESSTVYLDDGGKTAGSVNEEWDGLGSFRKITHYGFDGLPYRIQRVDYNNADPNNSECPGLSQAHCDNWIIGTKTYSETLDPSGVILQRSEFAYDNLGRLKAQQDLLTIPTGTGGAGDPNTGTAGDIKTEFKYEGDVTCPSGAASYPTGNLCYKKTTDFGATSGVFEESYTYQSVSIDGQTQVLPYLATRKVGQFPWKAEDRVVDASTGLTRVSRDPNAVSTTFDYDKLGRLLSVDPDNIADPNSITELPVYLTYPNILTTQLEQAVDPNNKIYSKFTFDKLGRLVEVKKRQWDGTLASQKTVYDILGRTVSQSEWLDPNQAAQSNYPRTTFDYTMTGSPQNPAADPFGRVHAVTTADGKVARTEYVGVTSTVTVEGIKAGLDPNTFLDATTLYDKDAFGRLTRVISPRTDNGSPSVCSYTSSGADAYYTYDRLDRLVTVRLESQTSAANPACPSSSQYRSFTYDALGRQTSATNPENGTVVNLQYDAAGNLLKRQDAMGNVFFYQYDVASRLLKGWLDRTGPDPNVLILENTYDQTGFGYSLGKLTTTVSYDDAGQAVLREELYYNGMNGRLSQSKRRHGRWNPSVSSIGSQDQIVMDYKYNSLGLLRKQTYPEKANLGRTVLSPELTYAHGILTAMSDPNRGSIVDTLEYNPAGGVHKIKTRGNVETVIPPDVRNRPSSITVTKVGGAEHFASGSYAYDGAGNISAIGLDKFAYDALNRLVSAFVVDPAVSAKTDTLNWNYDPLGNMSGSLHEIQSGSTNSEISTTFGIASSNRTVSQFIEYDPGPPDANTTMTYDGNGNLILDDEHEYIFDARNRLTEVHDPNGVLVAKYSYDASGYRISKYDAATQLTTFFVRDASGQTLSEFRRSNKPGTPFWLKDYVYAAGRHVAMVENEEPSVPSGFAISVSAIGAQTDFVSLTWSGNPEPDIAGYQVTRTCCEMWEEPPEPEWFDVSNPQLYDTNVLEGIAYTYYISAYDTAGRTSAQAPSIRAAPADQGLPGAPTAGLAVAGDGRVTLNWTAPSSTDLWGYQVYRKPSSSGTWNPLGGLVSKTQTNFIDTTAVNDTQYDYQVKSVDTAGWMSYGVPGTFPAIPHWRVTPADTTPPEVPQGLYALSDANSVDLYWVASVASDLQKYEVFRSTSPINPVDPNGAVLAGEPTVAHLGDPNGITANTLYYYRVWSKDQKGNVSALSAQIEVLTRMSVADLPAPTISTSQAQEWGYEYCRTPDPLIPGECRLPHNQTTITTSTTCYQVDDPSTLGVPPTWYCPPWTHQNGRTATIGWSPGSSGADLVGFRLYGRQDGTDPWQLWAEYPEPYYIPAVSASGYEYDLYDHYPVAVDDYQDPGEYRYKDVAFNPEDFCQDTTFRVSALAMVNGQVKESVLSTVASQVTLEGKIAVPENVTVTAESIDPEGCTNCNRLNPQFYGLTLNWMPGGSSCSSTYRGYNVYRNRHKGLFGTTPPIRLNREPLEVPMMRVEYLPIAGPEAGNGSPIPVLVKAFDGAMGYAEIDNNASNANGDACPMIYAVTSIDGSWIESATSNAVLSYSNATEHTGVASLNSCVYSSSIGPLNTEIAGQLAIPSLATVVAPGAVITPTWTWRYGSDPNAEDVGPESGNWALVKWTLPAIDPNHGPANDFRLLRMRPNQSQYSELVLSSGEYLDLIPGDDGGIRQFIWQMPQELACEDANYAIQSFDLYDRAGGTATLAPVLRHKLRPENVVIDGDGSLIDAWWDSLPNCPTGSYTHQVTSFKVMVSGQSSCGGSPPDPGTFTVHATAGSSTNYAYFAPKTPTASYWYALRAEWSDGASEMSPAVCITGGGFARLVPEQEGPPEEAGWEVAELLGQEDGAAAGVEKHETTPLRGEFTPSPHRSVGEGGSTNPAVSLSFYHLDHLGTPRVITDVNGNAVSKHKYLPFGEEMSPPASTNTHEFTGHERDAETGLDYMKARYYTPSFGRFLSTDPVRSATLRAPQSHNKYTYANNNPIAFVDLSGQFPIIGPDSHQEITRQADSQPNHVNQKDVIQGNFRADAKRILNLFTDDKAHLNEGGPTGSTTDTRVEAATQSLGVALDAFAKGQFEAAGEALGASHHSGQDLLGHGGVTGGQHDDQKLDSSNSVGFDVRKGAASALTSELNKIFNAAVAELVAGGDPSEVKAKAKLLAEAALEKAYCETKENLEKQGKKPKGY